MNDNTHYLTPEGKAKLEAELKHLKEDERKKISERLKQAISMGDLSENADYQKAKEDQGFLEGRIQEIEAILLHAEVIEAQVNYDEVAIGAKVTFKVADDPLKATRWWTAMKPTPAKGKYPTDLPLVVRWSDIKWGIVLKSSCPIKKSLSLKS